MDEMRFMGGFANRILAKLLEKTIKKKTGMDVKLSFKEVKTTIEGGSVNVHFEGDAELYQTSLSNFLQKTDLI